MSWDTRIGIAGLIMGLAGIGFTILWPSKRRLGWVCLSMAILLGFCWGYIEFWGAFLRWLNGTHGPWLYMFVGAASGIFGLALIGVLISAAKSLKTIEKSPKGFLDYKHDAEIAMSALPSLTGRLTIIMEEVGASFNKHSQALSTAGSTDRQLRAIKEAAASLDNYSARVDRICTKLVKTGRLLSDGMVGWSQWLEAARPSKEALGGEFPEVLRAFVGTLDTSNNHLRQYITSVGSAKGAASTMDAAIDKHIRSVHVVLDTNVNIYKACNRTLTVIDGLT